MKFKEFINENADLKKILSKYSYAIKSDIVLWRGINENYGAKVLADERFEYPMYEVARRKDTRESTAGNDFFLNLVSNWEGVPKRKFSTSVSQAVEATELFGLAAVILPANSVKLFGRTEEDFNYADINQSQLRSKMTEIAAMMALCINNASESIATIDVDAYNKYPRYMRELLNKRHDLLSHSLRNDVIGMHNKLKNLNLTVDEFVAEVLNPEKMGVETYNGINNIPVDDIGDEIWFEGPYLMISVGNEVGVGLEIKKQLRALLK